MEVREVTSPPERLGAGGPKAPENVSRIPEVKNMQQNRQHDLYSQEGLKNSLHLAGQNAGSKNLKFEKENIPLL